MAKRKSQAFQLMKLDLPKDVGLENIEVFDELATQLSGFARDGGNKSNPKFRARQAAMLQHIEQGKHVTELLHEPADIRTLLGVWREKPMTMTQAPFDDRTLQAVTSIAPNPARTLLWQLAQLYLEHYELLPCHQDFGTWLGQSFQAMKARAGESADMRAWREYRRLLFGRQGVAGFVKEAKKRDEDLLAFGKQLALPEMSQFFQRAKHQFYLEPLQKAKLGSELPIFKALSEPTVKTSIMRDGLLLGHHAAKILMDKALEKQVPLPENWRHLVLSIMEDPRVPRASERFQMWWARLDRKYVIAMRGWLSQLDLKLFLNVLEDVAKSNRREDLLRMYPARKRFLEHLYEQGVIKASRLILASQAEKYIRSNFETEELPEFGRLIAPGISLIYLNLGSVHLLEGTHSFQVRLYRSLPIPGLADYEEDKFHLSAIRKYQADFEIRHSPKSEAHWQNQLVERLRLFGVDITPP
ncbi:MAG: EH signature domain-containing protein [Pseudomonadota bacterium]